jgi:cytochrome c biogenesis protein CcmG/thiol:disulfide interchange protein DsbE
MSRSGKVNVKVLLLGLALVLPLVALLAVGFRFDPREIASPLVGKPAPDFTLEPLGGGAPVQLSALGGKPAVVNFWATWCVPCQAEHPVLLALARQFEGKVNFLGVVYQDKPEAIQAWLERRGTAYPQLVDVGSRAALAYGVYGVPETYVIDANGIIVEKIAGAVDGRTLQAQLLDLVGSR